MTASTPTATTLPTMATSETVESTAATAEGREEEDKKGKVKEFSLSKTVGVFLERENKFFLGIKEGNPKLLGEEV